MAEAKRFNSSISWKAVGLVAVIAFFIVLSGNLLSSYIEAWFPVLLGWFLVPVLLKKIYDRVSLEHEKK
jgi:hypothetical protein